MKQRLELPLAERRYLTAGSRSGCAVFDFGDFGAVDLLPETTSLGCLGWSCACCSPHFIPNSKRRKCWGKLGSCNLVEIISGGVLLTFNLAHQHD